MEPTNAAPTEAVTPAPVPLEERIVDVISTCYDPEIPVNIHELGLIYGIDVGENNAVKIRMTLTSPACPAAGSLPPEVERKVRGLAEVTRRQGRSGVGPALDAGSHDRGGAAAARVGVSPALTPPGKTPP